MNRIVVACSLSLALASGCSPNAMAPGASAPRLSVTPTSSDATSQQVYWTLFASPTLPQVEIAKVPLKKNSSVTDIDGTSHNGLNYTNGLTFYKGQLWILALGKSRAAPGNVLVFDLPLTASSTPHYTFALSGTSGPLREQEDALAFDPSGNLWVSAPAAHAILMYKGPFTESGTLKTAFKVHTGSLVTYAIAIDKAANLYFANASQSSTDSIGVLAPPYNGKPYYLTGLSSVGGLLFDSKGNLYASSNGSSSALVRYDSNNLGSGAMPNVVDPAGLPSGSYLASFAFTAKGDLYAANCGAAQAVGVDVYSLSTEKLTSKLAPSLLYTNANIASAGCVWGIAVH